MYKDFYGIIPPLVTPFGADDTVQEDLLRGEVRTVLETGVHGICTTGSTGEGHAVTDDEAAEVARVVLDEVDGHVPVIGGIIRNSTRQVINTGLRLKETGVDGLQITPVHYLFRPDEDETVDYYREIAKAVGLPIVIYNVIPWQAIQPRTLARVMNEVNEVVGVKQSGGDVHKLAELLLIEPLDGKVMTAIDDLLYPTLMLGAEGAIAATLTVAPRLCVELWDAVQEGDKARGLEIHGLLMPIWNAIDGPNMPARIKYSLERQGRGGGQPRHPLGPIGDEEKEVIDRALEHAGLLTT